VAVLSIAVPAVVSAAVAAVGGTAVAVAIAATGATAPPVTAAAVLAIAVPPGVSAAVVAAGAADVGIMRGTEVKRTELAAASPAVGAVIASVAAKVGFTIAITSRRSDEGWKGKGREKSGAEDGGELQILAKRGARTREKWGVEEAEVIGRGGRGGNDGAMTVDAERTRQSRTRPVATHLSTRSQRPCDAEWSHRGVCP